MSDKAPLLRTRHSQCSARSGSSTPCCYPFKVPKCLCFSTLFAVGLFFLFVPLIIGFIVELHSYNKPDISRLMSETRSGTHSLLGVPWSGACAKSRFRITLVDPKSSVEVSQAPCDTIPMSQFLVHIPRNDIDNTVVLNGVPITLISENRSPNNYFVNGSLKVLLANVTLTNSLSSEVDLCLFTNPDKYNKFSTAGSDWKRFKGSATCKRKTLYHGGDVYSLSFNITTPSFIFLGIASEDSLELGVNVSGVGYKIDGFGNQSIGSCHLNGDNYECDLNASSRSSQSVCIVAYEEDDASGSYHYSKVEIVYPADVCIAKVIILGFFALGVLIIFVLTISVILVIGRKHSRRNNATDSVGGESQPGTVTGNINSEAEGTGRRDNVTGRPFNAVTSISKQEDCTTDRSKDDLVVPNSIRAPNRIPSKPTTVKRDSHADHDHPPTPAPEAKLPVQETLPSLNPDSTLLSRSTEVNSDDVFSHAYSATT